MVIEHNAPAGKSFYIPAGAGTGKSTLMEAMILQDIRAGRGLAVIDPHGEMVDSILGSVHPEMRYFVQDQGMRKF